MGNIFSNTKVFIIDGFNGEGGEGDATLSNDFAPFGKSTIFSCHSVTCTTAFRGGARGRLEGAIAPVRAC